jgi:hypothetical protein
MVTRTRDPMRDVVPIINGQTTGKLYSASLDLLKSTQRGAGVVAARSTGQRGECQQ